MSPLVMALAATLAVSLLSLAGIVLALFGGPVRRGVLFVMVAFAAGAMMAASFFHLLPEAAGQVGWFAAGVSVIAGFSLFFLLERFLHWHHCHKGECDIHPFTTLSLLGDSIHNFLDGIVIGAAFLASPVLGLSATVVIAAHELPQELGDFAVLMHGGYSKGRALGMNLLTAMTALVGAVAANLGLSEHSQLVPYLMGFAAGNFIYISSSDLIPELHKERDLRKAMLAFVFFLLAVGCMAAFAFFNNQGHAH